MGFVHINLKCLPLWKINLQSHHLNFKKHVWYSEQWKFLDLSLILDNHKKTTGLTAMRGKTTTTK